MSPSAAASRAPGWARLLIAVLLLAPVGLALHSLREKSWTWDEPIYLAGGHYLLHTGNLRNQALSYHPPLAMYWNSVGLLPLQLEPHLFPLVTTDYDWEVGMQVAFRSGHDPERVRLLARLPFVCLTPLLGLLVYSWSRDLWGWKGGLISLWLVTWNPTLLAHARLVATDYLFTLLCVATLWSARALLRRGGFLRLLRTGGLVGLACLAKFSAVIVVPMAAVGAWCAVRITPGSLWRTWTVRRVSYSLLTLGVLALVVIWLGYLREVNIALLDPDQRAIAFEMGPPPGLLGQLMHYIYTTDLPLPAMTYLMGFFSQYAHGAGGHSNYLLGEVSLFGWWYYFPVALAVKTPLPELALWGAGLWACRRQRAPLRECVWLLGPVAVLLILSTRANINIGVRHALIAYPLGAIVAGACVQWWRDGGGKLILALGLVAVLGITLSIHPHYLTYFNCVAGGPSGGHRVLVDSNLDWGQDVDALFARAQAEHWLPMQVQYFGPPNRLRFAPPGFTELHAPCEPATGYVAVSVTNRVGAYMPDGAACMQWLDKYEPIANINHSIWVYHVPPESDDGAT